MYEKKTRRNNLMHVAGDPIFNLSNVNLRDDFQFPVRAPTGPKHISHMLKVSQVVSTTAAWRRTTVAASKIFGLGRTASAQRATAERPLAVAIAARLRLTGNLHWHAEARYDKQPPVEQEPQPAAALALLVSSRHGQSPRHFHRSRRCRTSVGRRC